MAEIKKKQQKSQITPPTMTQKRKRKKLSQAQIALILRHRRKQRLQKYWDYFLLFVAIAFCIFFLTNYKAHQIVGNSMLPTLASGDRILIKKTQNIQRFDIVTFRPDEKNTEETYIKRVIGMPGDSFVVQGTNIYLFLQKSIEADFETMRYAGNLPDSTEVLQLDKTVADNLRNETKIPEDYYFVLGDNRKNSADSRILGLVPKNSLEGVMKFRFYPFNKTGMVH
ncbi:signal peptidase I [Enterococcus dispar]|uniref:signal peptidase I n=1 Tax=Enterococcus dispar TaxID=44009 RepID=UPI00189D52C8|nr:signal peptidase I [Enterococcus dispar]